MRTGGKLTGYEFSRLSNFCGQMDAPRRLVPDRVLRLFRREAGRFPTTWCMSG